MRPAPAAERAGGRAAEAAAAAPRPGNDDSWRGLAEAASAAYRPAGRFAWHFARGKLRMDPVFCHLIRHGLVAPRSRVLDIGCGQGLLAHLLRAAARQARHGDWPADWAAAPLGCHVSGIELMPKDVLRARSAWQAAAAAGTASGAAATSTRAGAETHAEFTCGDMRETPFPAADVVVILDVLHYITVAEQDAVLDRVRQALAPGGRLLLRVGDAAARRGFGLSFGVSQWIDRLIFTLRGHRSTPLHGRPLAQWTARLESLGFSVQAQPMSQGTPFANVLLTAQLPVAAAADRRRTGRRGARDASHPAPVPA